MSSKSREKGDIPTCSSIFYMTLSLITDINLNQHDCNSTLNLDEMWSNRTHLLLVNAAMKTTCLFFQRTNKYPRPLP